MHVIDNGTDSLSQRDRRPGAGDIGAEARDERLTAGVKQAGCCRRRGSKSRRHAINPGVIH
jgi:hypothetical protein